MSIANRIDVCPLCETAPTVTGFFRFQVKCACGACGPKMPSEREAIGRWNSVVRLVEELRETDWLGTREREGLVAPAC